MSLLGYTLFVGKYGNFTVPVIEVTGFTIPSTSNFKSITLSAETESSIESNSLKSIFSLVPNPPLTPIGNSAPAYDNPFIMKCDQECGLIIHEQSIKLSDATYPDDYFDTITAFRDGYKDSSCHVDGVDKTILYSRLIFFFNFPDVDPNKYFLKFGAPSYNTPSLCEFVFFDTDLDDYYTNIPIQQTALFESNYKDLKLTPELPRIDRGGSIQFKATAKYVNDDVDVTDVVKWGLSHDTITEPVSTLSGYTITSSGLLTADEQISENIVVSATFMGMGCYTTVRYKTTSGDSPYEPGGTSGQAGGNGSFDGPGGSWGDGIGPAPSYDLKPDLPNGSSESDSSNSGLFTRYAMTSSQLFVLGAALYGKNILTNIAKEIMTFLWNSPNEALISLISYPFDVTKLVLTQDSSIKFGALELENVTGKRLFKSSARIDWGEIELKEYWGNFLDYAPHTKIDLYLPWCTGMVPIDPHDCLPGKLNVVTNIELAKGTCIHNIFGNKGALIGTYSGTCGSQLPMTAVDSSGKALAFVTAAASALIAGAAAGGAKSAGIASANDWRTTAKAYALETAKGLEPMAARNIVAKEAIVQAEAPYNSIKSKATKAAIASSIAAFRIPPSVTRSGSFTSNGAGLSIQYPYIMLSRPEQNIPDKYGRHYGYPSNVYRPLGTVVGYTEVSSIHLDGIRTATINELEELESLLKGGVIL